MIIPKDTISKKLGSNVEPHALTNTISYLPSEPIFSHRTEDPLFSQFYSLCHNFIFVSQLLLSRNFRNIVTFSLHLLTNHRPNVLYQGMCYQNHANCLRIGTGPFATRKWPTFDEQVARLRLINAPLFKRKRHLESDKKIVISLIMEYLVVTERMKK